MARSLSALYLTRRRWNTTQRDAHPELNVDHTHYQITSLECQGAYSLSILYATASTNLVPQSADFWMTFIPWD